MNEKIELGERGFILLNCDGDFNNYVAFFDGFIGVTCEYLTSSEINFIIKCIKGKRNDQTFILNNNDVIFYTENTGLCIINNDRVCRLWLLNKEKEKTIKILKKFKKAVEKNERR